MKFKATLLLAAILGALLAYYWVVERPRPKSQDPRPLVLNLKAEDIHAVTLKGRGQTVRLVKQKDATWRLHEPVIAPADKIEIDSLLNRVASLRFDRALGKPEDVSPYGLKEPRQRVILETAQGTATVAFGDDAPVGGLVYTTNQESREVGLVSLSLQEMAPDPFKWRDKKVIRIERSRLGEIQIQKDSRRVRLVRESGGWWIGKPGTLRADRMRVDSLILDLEALRASGFPEAAAAQGSREMLRVQLAYSAGGEPAATLALRRGKDDTLFATMEGNPQVFQVASDALKEIIAFEEAYYQEAVLSILPFHVRRMEIVPSGSAAYTLTKQDDTWSAEDKPDLSLDQTQMADLLDRLLGLYWKRVEAREPKDLTPYGLNPPAFAITFKGAEGKTLGTLQVGKRRGNLVWVKDAEARAVLVVQADKLGSIPKTPEALKAKAAPSSPEQPASQVQSK